MSIEITNEQYVAMAHNATPGAEKRICAACMPAGEKHLLFTPPVEAFRVLEMINRDDMADAATRVKWTTLRGGALHCTPAWEGKPTPDAPQMPQDSEVAPAATATAPRQTKGRTVLEMLQAESGATNAEIMAATGWQTHTVRGFFAGAQLKAMGYRAVRIQREDETAAYKAEQLQAELA